MRFQESLDRIRFRFYSLRYGEEEATTIMRLHGKDRAKHLAMLDEHGPDAEKMEAQRVIEPLFQESLNAIADVSLARTQLAMLNEGEKDYQGRVEKEEDENLIGQYQAQLNLIREHRKDLIPKIETLKAISEEKSKAYEKALDNYIERYGDLLPVLKLEKRRETANDPTTIQGWAKALDRAQIRFFSRLLGANATNRIMNSTGEERWQIAVGLGQESPLRTTRKNIRATQISMMEFREDAVKLISMKHALEAARDAIIAQRIVATEIPDPSQPLPNEADYQANLDAISILIDTAFGASETAKVLAKMAEEDARRQSVQQQIDAVKSITDATKPI